MPPSTLRVDAETAVDVAADRVRGTGRAASWLAALVAVLILSVLFTPAPGSAKAGAPAADEGRLVFALPGAPGSYLNVSFLSARTPGADPAAAAASIRASILASAPGMRELPASSSLVKWVRNGYWWPSHQVALSYNAAGKPASLEGDADAIAAAAQTWNSASSNFHFESLGTTDDGTGACSTAGDGRNTVAWGPLEGTLLAVTCSLFRNDGGPLSTATEFDMKLDPEWAWSTGSPATFDLQSVVTHEFGHALGLGHSPDTASIMFADYPQNAIKRALTNDDRDGLLGLYSDTVRLPAAPVTRTLALSSGSNLITWVEDDTDAAHVTTSISGAIRAIYSYDPRSGTWLHYFPDGRHT